MESLDDDFMREMQKIDVEAIAREFGEHPITEIKPGEKAAMSPRPQTAPERCNKTGKVSFITANDAIEALKRWKMKDPKVCWDIGRMRIYHCKKCHYMHLGKG